MCTAVGRGGGHPVCGVRNGVGGGVVTGEVSSGCVIGRCSMSCGKAMCYQIRDASRLLYVLSSKAGIVNSESGVPSKFALGGCRGNNLLCFRSKGLGRALVGPRARIVARGVVCSPGAPGSVCFSVLEGSGVAITFGGRGMLMVGDPGGVVSCAYTIGSCAVCSVRYARGCLC